MDVTEADGTSEQRGDLGRGEACDAAADAGHQEGHLGMAVGEAEELIHVGLDSIHATLHGGDGIALSLQAHALAHDGTKPIYG